MADTIHIEIDPNDTIGDIIERGESKDSDEHTPLEQLVMGAYWAGEEDERLRLSDEIREALDDVPEHRYYKIQGEVADAVRHCLAPTSGGPEILSWTAKP